MKIGTLVSWFLILLPLYTDIKSTDGTLGFDVESDGDRELILNTTGLGVGITPSSNLHVQGNAVVKQIDVGGTSGSSNFNLHGSVGMSVQAVSSNVTLSEHSIVLVDTTSGNLVVDLPSVSGLNGRKYSIKKS